MTRLSHIDKEGRVRMVDVTDKRATERTARAQAVVRMSPETFDLLRDGKVPKGNVLETARIAGIMAAKQTAGLIPMCHPLNITHVRIDFSLLPEDPAVRIESLVRIVHQTGVEMEALTAAAVAGLTIYDMCKAMDKAMVISDVMLLEKTGGKSGTFRRREG